MSQRTFAGFEGLVALLSILFCLSQAETPKDPGPLVLGTLLALALDRLKVSFPFYGFTSVGPAAIVSCACLESIDAGLCGISLTLLALLRLKPTADILPACLALASLSSGSLAIPYIAVILLFSSLIHPLLRSRFFPRLPGAMTYRLWPFHLGCSAVIGLAALNSQTITMLIQVPLLIGLIGLVRSQRGLNLETAHQQEARLLQNEQTKESLLLIDAMGYSLHEEAQPEQVLSKVSSVMVKVSKADTMALIERDGPRWRLVEEHGVGQQLATKAFAKREKELPRDGKARRLKAGWVGEEFALILPWEGEAALYLGRKSQALDSVPLLERLARLGAAALRTSHEKAQRQALGERGSELEQWVGNLTSLLEEVHFVGATLERADLLERLKVTLARTVLPDAVVLFGREHVEESWGSVTSVPELESLQKAPLGKPTALSPVPGHQASVCVQLGKSRMLLSFLSEKTLTSEGLHYLAVLGDIVGTFLSNSQLYSQLRQTHLDLEQSQTDLVQAKKLAAVGQLAAGVAHELNSPFQAISVHLDLVRGSLTDEDDIECVDTIGDALERCRVIVKELLNFSRRPSAPPSQLSVKKILSQAATSAGIDKLPIACAEELQIVGHDHELVSLFTNLLSNARDAVIAHGKVYPPEGIRVRAKAQDQDIVIEVQDQGGGIPKAVEERIFEPFFTTKEVGSGTGLGLYMVYTYVSNAGGEIRLKTEPGEGTTFVVRLPARVDAGMSHA
jgi:signal transduction histidine kinase